MAALARAHGERLVRAALAIGVLGVALGTPAPAAAHTDLVATEPARGATVTTLDAVRLRFSEDLRPEFAAVVITGADGTRVDTGSPAVLGQHVAVPVAPLRAGTYTVAFRVLSADGHPVQGSWDLTYAPSSSSTSPASPVTPVTPVTPSAGGNSGGAEGTSPLTIGIWGVGGGVLAGAAVAGAGLVRRHRARDDD